MYLVMLVPYKICFLAALSGLSIYVCIESILATVLFAVTGFTLHAVLNNIWLRVAFFAPEAIALTLIILLIRRFNIRLADYSNFWMDLESPKVTKQTFQINKSFPLICLFLAQTFMIALFYSVNYVGFSNGSAPKTLTSTIFPAILIIAVMPVATVIMIRRVVARRRRLYF